MLLNIEKLNYLFDRKSDGKKILLGVHVIVDRKNKDYHSTYVGIPLTLDDILTNRINAHILKVEDLELFKKQFEEANAKGVVYFPQAERYQFLKDTDEVIQWDGNDYIHEMLENYLMQYRDYKTEAKLKMQSEENKKVLGPYIDPDDAMAELWEMDMPLTRKHSSR